MLPPFLDSGLPHDPGRPGGNPAARASRAALVSTAWLAEHLTDPHLAIVEASRDLTAFGRGHIAGAVDWSPQRLLTNPVRGVRPFAAAMERLLAASGIDNYSTVIVYGDAGNRVATAAVWRLALCGHADVRLLDGGREKWAREGRALDANLPARVHTTYKVTVPDRALRAVPRDLTSRAGSPASVVVDGGLGAIGQPGAVRVPWSSTLNDDGTFKKTDALESLFTEQGLTRLHRVITCSTDAAASAHLWFALSRVLGFPHVRHCEGV
jgi:thiosulfate/3-mercaptopyruvate sulfurtransferase